MNFPEKVKCNVIIHSASVAAGAIGAATAQIPFADSIPLSGIQIAMIMSLGKAVFGIKLSKTAASAIIHACAASFVGRTVVKNTTGWIPVAGNVISASTASGLTEIMGWFVANAMSKNMTPEQIIAAAKKEKDKKDEDAEEDAPNKTPEREEPHIDIPDDADDRIEDYFEIKKDESPDDENKEKCDPDSEDGEPDENS